MPNFYITGDCHKDYRKIEIFCARQNTSIEDYMIVLGDFGINYWLDKTDLKEKQKLSKLPISFLIVHGNHEARPYEIESYEEKMWNGGVVYVEPEFPNLLFAKDGEIYTLNDKRCMAIGGAYSVDKNYRLLVRMPWFESEQPSKEIKQYVEKQLEANNWTVDYIFSHTCPYKYEPTDLFLDFIDQSEVDKSTEEWLTAIEKKMTYKKWYFGHFHENIQYVHAEMFFEMIKELGADDFIQCIGRPKYRKGEMVLFYIDDGEEKRECYGGIAIVDAYGTFEQAREVSYDIRGVDGVLYKHVLESEVCGIREMRDVIE